MCNSCVSHSHCNLCENPYPYMCNECNGVIAESEPSHLPTLSELAAAIPVAVEKGLSTIRRATSNVGFEVKNTQNKRIWIGSGEDAFDFYRHEQF